MIDPIKKVVHQKNENAELREALAINYSGVNHLYRDDGELQDSRHPIIDWRRDPWERIKDAMHRRAIAAMEEAINAKKPGAAPTAWGTDPWTRAGGDCLCSCGAEYRRHKTESGPGYGSCGDEVLVLQRLCDGTLVHL